MKNERKSIYYDVEIVDPYSADKKDFLVKAEHLTRYYFARNLSADFRKKPLVVYDIGCGNGYGTKILATVAEKVFGFEKNKQFLREANDKNKLANTTYFRINLDAENLKEFKDRQNIPTPDFIVCFETIEHLENPSKFLKELNMLLPNEGHLICSIPNKKYEPIKDGKPKNPFHKHLFTRQETTTFLKESGFQIQGIYGQPFTNLLVRYFNIAFRYLDKYLIKNYATFEKWARILAYPVKNFVSFSYSLIFLVKK